MNVRAILAFAAVTVLAATAAHVQAASQPPTHGGHPAVSPDGSRIAFISDRGGATDLYVISADGTGETRLTDTPGIQGNHDWSADGKAIRYSVFSGDASRLYAVDPTGKDRRQIGSLPGRAGTLSPDGSRALYWTGTWTAVKLFVSDLDGSKALQLTDGTGVAWNTRWSPDGKSIAFTGRDASGILHVYVMSAGGGDRRQVTHFPPADGQAQVPAWSPDGKRLAVQSSAKGESGHVWIVDAASGAARKVSPHDEPYVDEVPAWFPDGKRLAFQSNRTGPMEIWIANADGTDQRQITK